mmetsp:Transcript_63684/g.170512  ORF Transcript_63684/g.170512 Transcript_63684/m.170512 type:complete len:208 (-) Transcript_63684:119-742(-)
MVDERMEMDNGVVPSRTLARWAKPPTQAPQPQPTSHLFLDRLAHHRHELVRLRHLLLPVHHHPIDGPREEAARWQAAEEVARDEDARAVVLKVVGRVPEGHDGLVHVLAHRSARLVDALRHRVEVLGEDGNQLLELHPRRSREVHHFGEHGGDVARTNPELGHLAEVHHAHDGLGPLGHVEAEGPHAFRHVDEAVADYAHLVERTVL